MDPYNISEAVSVGIKHIGIAIYSSGKIREYLIRKGYDPDTARSAVAQLVEREYIDDIRAGRKVLASRVGRKQESKSMISQRLKAAGVSYDAISTLISDCEDDRITCRRLIESSFPELTVSLLLEDDLSDIITLDSRRGYSPDVTTSVIRDLINDIPT